MKIQSTYDAACHLSDNKEFEAGMELFNSISSFSDSKQKSIVRANQLTNECLADDDINSAIERYLIAGNTAAINDTKYNYAKSHMSKDSHLTYEYL